MAGGSVGVVTMRRQAMESELKSIDGQHYRWAMTCPTCQIEFGGVIKRKGWLQFDPVCPECQRTIAGFTNLGWPPGRLVTALDHQMTDELVEFILALRRAPMNLILRLLRLIGRCSDNEEMRCSQ